MEKINHYIQDIIDEEDLAHSFTKVLLLRAVIMLTVASDYISDAEYNKRIEEFIRIWLGRDNLTDVDKTRLIESVIDNLIENDESIIGDKNGQKI